MAKPWKVLLVLVFVAVALVLLLVGAVGWAAWKGRVPKQALLEIDFAAPMVEQVPDNALASLFVGRRMRLRDVVEALHAAAGDPHVVGLVARVDPGNLPLAQVEELRDAVIAFRASGKPTV